MLQVLLLILKILGILLAAGIGLLVLALLLILLVPVRYRAWGRGNAGKKEFQGDVRITWLLHLISVRGKWETGTYRLRVRAAGIPVYDSAKPKREKRKKEEAAEEQREEPVIASLENVPPEQNAPPSAEAPLPPKMEQEEQERRSSAEAREKGKRKKRSSGGFRRICRSFQTCKKKARELLAKGKNWKKRLEGLAERARFFWDLAHSPHFARAWAKLKKELLKIVRHARPRKLEADLHVGLENPADMGKVTAVAGMLYPIYTDHIRFRPDFEEPALEGAISFHGRIRLGTLFLAGLRVLLDKDIKRVIRELRSGKKEVSYGKG